MTKPTITIGDVRLPLHDFAFARTAVLGITKSGKTFAAKGIAEQLLAASIPIVVFDAIGVWRFLKTPAPGGRGFPVVIAGGAQPDLPLTPHSAPEIVRAAIRENIPLVIDLYYAKLSRADWRRIVQHSFRTLLYENKGLRHIMLEESAEFAPQKVLDGETYAEVEKVACMGGNAQLGITMINQRAQELNKAVLELCDNLVLLRQRGSHAIGALEMWLDRVSPDTAREISRTLPHMGPGECWVWAEESDRPVRTRTGTLKSFHPDRRANQAVAPKQPSVDTGDFVTRLSGELGALVEQAKANDPAQLRRRITELERELRAAKAETPDQEVIERARAQGIEEGERQARGIVAAADRVLKHLRTAIEGRAVAAGRLEGDLRSMLGELDRAEQARPVPGVRPVATVRTQPVLPRPAPAARAVASANGHLGAERKLLSVLVSRAPVKLTKAQLGTLSGLAWRGGTFGTYLSRLRTAGYVEEDGNLLTATSEGIEAVGHVPPSADTPAELCSIWRNAVGSGAAGRLLDELAAAGSTGLSPEELAGRCNLTHGAGTFGTYLSRLRSNALLVESGGRVRLVDEML